MTLPLLLLCAGFRPECGLKVVNLASLRTDVCPPSMLNVSQLADRSQVRGDRCGGDALASAVDVG